jgi:hypothetical protein
MSARYGSIDVSRPALSTMSIYRISDRCPRSDVYAPAIEDRRLALARPSAASLGNLDLGNYQHLRKATPANRAFPRTLTWISTLPADIRPTALVRRYPRIANLIAAVWGDSSCFASYMESLLTDKRGNRRGFPPDVSENLLSLQRYYRAMQAKKSIPLPS